MLYFFIEALSVTPTFSIEAFFIEALSVTPTFSIEAIIHRMMLGHLRIGL